MDHESEINIYTYKQNKKIFEHRMNVNHVIVIYESLLNTMIEQIFGDLDFTYLSVGF